jgi:hypothetical protein
MTRTPIAAPEGTSSTMTKSIVVATAPEAIGGMFFAAPGYCTPLTSKET